MRGPTHDKRPTCERRTDQQSAGSPAEPLEGPKLVTHTYGAFPFGRPNTVRPMRPSEGPAQVTVVGVYPSAWHVSWTAPAYTYGSGRTGRVKALAVDVEPTVFWDGDHDGFVDRLSDWTAATGFLKGDDRGQHGHIAEVSPSTNGSSGRTVSLRYLPAVGASANQTAFTDIYPVFMVHRGGGKRRTQGDAIAQEYDSIAPDMIRQPSSLTTRIPPGQVPGLAAKMFGPRIVADLEAADADLVITLGSEPFEALLLLPELAASPPAESLVALFPDGYGRTGTLRVNGRQVDWLPLVHPGLLKGGPNPVGNEDLAAGRRTPGAYNSLHRRWEKQLGASS